MSQFTKIGNAFFRQDDSGQLTAVTDPETMKGLKTGHLGYTAVENTRGLTFANPGLTSSATQSRDQLNFGSPAPVATQTANPVLSGNVGADGQQLNIESMLKTKLKEAFSNYKGVTNIAELEAKRQSILRKQLLSSPYSEDGEKNMTGAQKLALLREKGKEYEPLLSGLDIEIAGMKAGNKEDLERLTVLSTVAEKMGLLVTPKDEMDMAVKRAQIMQINEGIKTEAYQRKYIEAQIGKIEADIAGSAPDVASSKNEALTNYNLVNEIIDNPNLSAVTGLTRFTTGLLPSNSLVKNKVNQLNGILSLENRQKLKGSGSVSDFEAKILSQAASALGTNLATEDYIKEAKKVQAVFANAAGMSVPVKITDDNTGEFQIVQADRAGINSAIEDGMTVEYSF